jgi:hypothetical protein
VGFCDAHGFLVTASKEESRGRRSKHSTVEFSFALGIPDCQAETQQLFTRSGNSDGEGQMLMKKTVRSGNYGFCIRYKALGIGMDTDLWELFVSDPAERLRRHQAVLMVLRDMILSPGGAMTSTLLPQLSGLRGAVVIRTGGAGRAAIYSPLKPDFVEMLKSYKDETTDIRPFATASEFHSVMADLIYNSIPATSKIYSLHEAG